MPMDISDYPPKWKLISRFVREYRAKNRCERCNAENGKPHPETGSKVVLTTAHIYDKTPSNPSLMNLQALCQKCHLGLDRADRTKALRSLQLGLFGRRRRNKRQGSGSEAPKEK